MEDFVERICISVNSRCNLACKYCYFFNPENRIEHDKDLTSNEIFEILIKINEYSIESKVKKKIKVNFVGSGEPLLSWNNIKLALKEFNKITYENIKFYTVTNATLITDVIAKELQEYNVFPSISLDGYKEIHDLHRVDYKMQGSFYRTMTGIKILQRNGFDIAINTVASKTLKKNILKFFKFLNKNTISKVIFDRIVDTPHEYTDILSNDEFYDFLITATNSLAKINLFNKIEIGNIEAYNRNLQGRTDKVCTMFGSTCGAGTNFLIYIGKDIYPCGRMFGKKKWVIGNYSDDIIDVENNMLKKIPYREDCRNCKILDICHRDCLLEAETENYSCEKRIAFFKTLNESK